MKKAEIRELLYKAKSAFEEIERLNKTDKSLPEFLMNQMREDMERLEQALQLDIDKADE